jgi:hypothetical protein
MKNSKFVLVAFLIIFLGVANTFTLTLNYNSSLIKIAQADEDEGEEDDENEDEEENENEDEDKDSTNRNVNVSQPVLQGTPRSIAPAIVPAAVPALLMAPSLIPDSLPQIDIQKEIENRIKSNSQLGETIKSIDLKPIQKDGQEILEGQAIKSEKILGLFNIQIPSIIEVNSKTGEIIKVSQSFWNSFLDFISF